MCRIADGPPIDCFRIWSRYSHGEAENIDIGRRTKYEPTNLKLLEHGKGRLIGIKFVKTAKTSSYYSYGKIG